MKKILISSTNTIEGAKIEKYLDVISTNVVVGTNFFSDFGASLTDIFGGYSGTYEKKLQEIYKIGIDGIKAKAINMGANAVVGVKIDFDEISGKGKSMFMISVFGTALRIKAIEDKKILSQENNEVISLEALETEFKKRILIEEFNKNLLPNLDDWNYLLVTPIEEITQTLLDFYFKRIVKRDTDLSASEGLLVKNTPTYFRALDEEFAVEILYANIEKNPQACLDIIEANNLFSAKQILQLIEKSETDVVIDCLPFKKNYYTHEDLNLMKEILNKFDNLKDLGRIEEVKGVLGKTKEKYFCPNNHPNSLEITYCNTFGCGKNIKGLTKEQVAEVEKFRVKVESLDGMMG